MQLVKLDDGRFQRFRLLIDFRQKRIQLLDELRATVDDVRRSGDSRTEMDLQFLYGHVDLCLLDGHVAQHFLS